MRISSQRQQFAAGAIAVALVVIVAIVALDGRQSRRPLEPQPTAPTFADRLRRNDEPTYAYLTDRELAVVRGSTVTARAAGSFSSYGSHLSFTADARFVFAISDIWETNRRLVAVDVATGTQHRLGCGGCSRAVAFGGSRVAWMSQKDRLVMVDLAASRPIPMTMPVRLPPPQHPNSPNWSEILAHFDGSLLIARADGSSAYGGPQVLYRATANGRIQTIGTTQSNMAVAFSTQAAPASDGNARIAYVGGWHTGACYERMDVTLLDPAAGHFSATDSSALESSAIDGMAVSDLWLGSHGKLYATMSSWRCRPDQEHINTVPSSLWRLDGNRWVQVDGGPLLAVRQLTARVKAVVASNGSPDQGGPLYIQADGRRTKVADQVIGIAARLHN
jgi:hypothetical protein